MVINKNRGKHNRRWVWLGVKLNHLDLISVFHSSRLFLLPFPPKNTPVNKCMNKFGLKKEAWYIMKANFQFWAGGGGGGDGGEGGVRRGAGGGGGGEALMRMYYIFYVPITFPEAICRLWHDYPVDLVCVKHFSFDRISGNKTVCWHIWIDYVPDIQLRLKCACNAGGRGAMTPVRPSDSRCMTPFGPSDSRCMTPVGPSDSDTCRPEWQSPYDTCRPEWQSLYEWHLSARVTVAVWHLSARVTVAVWHLSGRVTVTPVGPSDSRRMTSVGPSDSRCMSDTCRPEWQSLYDTCRPEWQSPYDTCRAEWQSLYDTCQAEEVSMRREITVEGGTVPGACVFIPAATRSDCQGRGLAPPGTAVSSDTWLILPPDHDGGTLTSTQTPSTMTTSFSLWTECDHCGVTSVSEGADRVAGGQLRGATVNERCWTESGARSVPNSH